jgi:hypothetical protein
MDHRPTNKTTKHEASERKYRRMHLRLWNKDFFKGQKKVISIKHNLINSIQLIFKTAADQKNHLKK